MQDRKGEVVRNDIGLESTGNRMDRSESLLNNNSHDLEAEEDLHMEDVTVKSNSVPKRPIAINSFVKEELRSTTVSAHLDSGMKTSKISPNLPQFDVRPSEIIQKPSATSKSKEHSVAIERRLALWRQGDLNMLMKEIRFIQDRFVSSKRPDRLKTFQERLQS